MRSSASLLMPTSAGVRKTTSSCQRNSASESRARREDPSVEYAQGFPGITGRDEHLRVEGRDARGLRAGVDRQWRGMDGDDLLSIAVQRTNQQCFSSPQSLARAIIRCRAVWLSPSFTATRLFGRLRTSRFHHLRKSAQTLNARSVI